MRTAKERWSHFWFEPAEATNLAVCRILFFSAMFLVHLPRDISLWGTVEGVYYPLRLFKILDLPILSRESLAVLEVVWKAALVSSAAGLLTRVSTTVSFVLGFYLLALPHNFGKLHHYDGVIVMVLGVLALSCCGHALSLDRLLFHRGKAAAPRSGEYTWPVRTVWLLLSYVFFAAGVAKLRHSGLGWVSAENMQRILVAGYYHMRNADPLTRLGLHAAQHAWLSWLLAAGTLVFEAGYPLALVSRRMRWIMVPGMFLSLVGIRLLMGPTFHNFMICHLFWVPWDRLVRRAGSTHGR